MNPRRATACAFLGLAAVASALTAGQSEASSKDDAVEAGGRASRPPSGEALAGRDAVEAGGRASRPPSGKGLAAGDASPRPDTGVLIIKKDQPGPERTVRLKTTDGWWIVMTYRPPRKGSPVAVLVHGFGTNRRDWAGLAADLARKGWGTLALDLRGHGDSRMGPSGPVDFASIDGGGAWLDAAKDVEAALGYVRGQRIATRRLCLVGASIGANLVSRAAAADPGLGCAVLLSPRRDFQGVPLASPRPGLRALAAASRADPHSYEALESLAARRPGIETLDAARGHGAAMFQDRDFYRDLLRWLDNAARP